MTAPTREGLHRLLLHMDYEGPFGRLMNWLLAIDPITHELWREVRPGTPRDHLARCAEWADRRWREHYVRAGRRPPARWKRDLP